MFLTFASTTRQYNRQNHIIFDKRLFFIDEIHKLLTHLTFKNIDKRQNSSFIYV